MPTISDAERVRHARKQLGLTIIEFAKQLGIGRRSLINYEQGHTEVPRTLLMLIDYKLTDHQHKQRSK